MTDPASEAQFRKDLPKALVLLRESRGLSQQELAARMGFHSSVLSRYETGARNPSAGKLAELLEALVADFGELELALAEVRRARSEGTKPSAESVLRDAEASKDDVTVAFLAASREGRGQEFVERLMEQARYVAQLQARLNSYLSERASREAASNSEDEPKDGDDRVAQSNGNGEDDD